jgi:O-antigen/teichoic acid export membrane protein
VRPNRSVGSLMASGFVVTAFGALLNLGFIALLLGRFDAETAGLVVVAIAMQMLAVRLTDLGATTATVRFLSGAVHGGDRRDRRSVLRVYACTVPVVAVATSILGAVALVAAPWIGELLAADHTDEMTDLVRIGAVGLPALGIYLVLVHSLKGWQRFAAFRSVERLGRPGAFVLLAVVVPSISDDPAWLFAAMQLVHLAWSVGAAILVARLVGATPVLALPAQVRPSLGADLRHVWGFALPRGWNVIFDAGLAYFDTLLISAILGPGAAALTFGPPTSLAASTQKP